jgi:hypothetical protein
MLKGFWDIVTVSISHFSYTEIILTQCIIIGIFAYYFPRLFQEYTHMMEIFHKKYNVGYPLKHAVFAAASTNHGPRAITFEHTDQGNKANGICPIFCSGKFDPKKSGHLILRDLQLLVEFPPGTFILIPSAVLLHGNVLIGEDEERESLTLFSAGGLFRWLEYGFQSEKTLYKTRQMEFLAQEMEKRKTRWKHGLSQFSTIDSLTADWALLNS